MLNQGDVSLFQLIHHFESASFFIISYHTTALLPFSSLNTVSRHERVETIEKDKFKAHYYTMQSFRNKRWKMHTIT